MKAKRRYHSVADQIIAMIDDGTFPPNSRLPGERELSEQLGVSRVTVREAEIFLQARGVIEVRTGSGAFVLDPSKRTGSGPANVSAFELTEARTLFESEAAALAARHISDETLSLLESCLEKMRASGPGSEREAELADRDFHLAIAKASGNVVVHHVVKMLWQIRMEHAPVRTVYDSVCVEDSDARSAEHQAVFDALRERDARAARIAMREHFRRLFESMLDVTEEQALEEIRQKASKSRQRFLKVAKI